MLSSSTVELVKHYLHKKLIESSHPNEPAFKVYLNEFLVAEVRGNSPYHQTIIPMRELSDYEEGKLHEYITSLISKEES